MVLLDDIIQIRCRSATTTLAQLTGLLQLGDCAGIGRVAIYIDYARPWSYIGASQFTADGGRNNIYSNNFVLDGMPNTKAGGYVAFIPPMDSMQEFRVQTNAYDASIGRQAGATLNMQTKSGTKNYHLVLYWFNQNNILNAKLFQTNLVNGVKPPVHFNGFCCK